MRVSIRHLSEQNISAALDLCRSAGWNQLREDWSRLVKYEPEGCFAAEMDDRLVGTVTTTRYGKDLAWLGMMLVDPKFRRQGIATGLMNTALDYLRDQNVACVKLDATPAGQPVYSQLGFQSEWDFHRWSRPPQSRPKPRNGHESDTLRTIHIELDRRAFGADRSEWLVKLAQGSTVSVRASGYAMIRTGHLADYLGPVVAEDAATATELIVDLISTSDRDLFWDIPHVNLSAVEIASSLGFQPVRDLTRMWIGSPLVSPETDLQYALSDPGTG